MKLLICTQVVDSTHPILGFFHRWIEEFAKHCESVQVVCLNEGKHKLPQNVYVHSLGKEMGGSRFKYIYRFYRHIWLLRKEYDVVLVHMNPEYVLLGFVVWKPLGKKIGLWYMHRSRGFFLKFAEKLIDSVYTASKESFRLRSKKLHITGHGIDTEKFIPLSSEKDIDLLTVGRITPSKNIETLIDVLDKVRAKGYDVSLSVIGKPMTGDENSYQVKLEQLVHSKELSGCVHFLGGVTNTELPNYLARSRMFVHAATNGSLDKTLLESLLMNVPVVTSAEGATSLPLGSWHVKDTEDFVREIVKVLESDSKEKTQKLREFVKQNHSLQSLIPKILQNLFAS